MLVLFVFDSVLL